jgi:hypothetical protein
VRDLLKDPSDFSITDSVITLSKSFHREIVAEGVETTEHGLILLAMGCELAQGYGISKPIPAEKVQAWLKDYAPNKEWLGAKFNQLSTKTNKIRQFELATQYWLHELTRILSCNPPLELEAMFVKPKYCVCCAWIQSVKQEQLFQTKLLNELETAHHNMHTIARDLYKYQTQPPIKITNISFEKLEGAISHVRHLSLELERQSYSQ